MNETDNIIGGSPVKNISYPFIVRIFLKKRTHGGGALINNLYVLTCHSMLEVRIILYW